MLTDTYMYYVRKDKACQEETNTHTLCQDKGSYRDTWKYTCTMS